MTLQFYGRIHHTIKSDKCMQSQTITSAASNRNQKHHPNIVSYASLSVYFVHILSIHAMLDQKGIVAQILDLFNYY